MPFHFHLCSPPVYHGALQGGEGVVIVRKNCLAPGMFVVVVVVVVVIVVVVVVASAAAAAVVVVVVVGGGGGGGGGVAV